MTQLPVFVQTLPANGVLFAARLLARLIDLLLMAFGAVVIAVLLQTLHVDTRHLPGALGYEVLLVGQLWLYSALMESSPLQATLGKRALGLVVLNREGEQLNFARASGRHFARGLSDLLFFLGYFVSLFTPQGRALHDYLAGTLVVWNEM